MMPLVRNEIKPKPVNKARSTVQTPQKEQKSLHAEGVKLVAHEGRGNDATRRACNVMDVHMDLHWPRENESQSSIRTERVIVTLSEKIPFIYIIATEVFWDHVSAVIGMDNIVL